MLDRALAFARGVKERDFEGVLSVVLFGSVARGEATRESDIDIAIIYSEKDEDAVKEINSLAGEGIQLTHISLEELEDEPTIAGALSGEGVLLYGSPVVIRGKDMELKSKMLVAYDTSGLSQNDKNKLQRALYGGISTYKKDGKRIVKRYEGLVERISGERIGKGVLLVDRRSYPRVTGALKAYGAKWKEIPVWTY